MQTKTTTKSVKKKIKKVSSGQGIINGHFSFNNTILNLAKTSGQVLVQVSSGKIGFKNTQKATSYSAQKCVEKIIQLTLEHGIGSVILCVKGIGAGRDITIRKVLENNELKVSELIDKTSIPHGGCRPRKLPRK